MALRFFVKLDPNTKVAIATMGPNDYPSDLAVPDGYIEAAPEKADAIISRGFSYESGSGGVTPVIVPQVTTQLDRIETLLQRLVDGK